MITKSERTQVLGTFAQASVLSYLERGSDEFFMGYRGGIQEIAYLLGINNIGDTYEKAIDWARENCPGFSKRECVGGCNRCSPTHLIKELGIEG